MKSLGLEERVESLLRAHPVSISKKVDLYLSEQLPDLIDEYRLATKKDIAVVDRTFETYEGDIEELETWKNSTSQKVEDIEGRINRLEYKHGVRK